MSHPDFLALDADDLTPDLPDLRAAGAEYQRAVHVALGRTLIHFGKGDTTDPVEAMCVRLAAEADLAAIREHEGADLDEAA
jgi:hypothetical protein